MIKRLNLITNQTYLSELSQSGFKVVNFMKAIKRGEKFPPLSMVRSDAGLYLFADHNIAHYQSDGDCPDGGCHRLIAHYWTSGHIDYKEVDMGRIVGHEQERIKSLDTASDLDILDPQNAVLGFGNHAFQSYFKLCYTDPNLARGMTRLEKEWADDYRQNPQLWRHEPSNKIREEAESYWEEQKCTNF